MAAEPRELIGLTEQDEKDWREWLAEFERTVWPIFQRYGYSRDAALMTFAINRNRNALEDIAGLLSGPDENWSLPEPE